MEYLFVIWEGGAGASKAKRDEVMAEMGKYASDLVGKGKLKGGAPLQPTAQSVTVRKRRGKVSTVDGPYIETKEVIGGYFVVEAGSLEEAVEIAKDCPAAGYGAIEVREQMEMGSGMDAG
ncbi:MAG TPA: YciI family protein [Acidimicrobiales bacterium]